MTREEAIKKVSELSCAYNHIRMTECPHCAKEVEALVKMLLTTEMSINYDKVPEHMRPHIKGYIECGVP
ncbi:MAG: hypothetical protein ABIF11_00795, partial [Nitrospirota bacterium]